MEYKISKKPWLHIEIAGDGMLRIEGMQYRRDSKREEGEECWLSFNKRQARDLKAILEDYINASEI